MRFANPHPPRRGAFFLIALFSCLQIFFGFFLFTENGTDSVLSKRSSTQIASYRDISQLNAIMPASGDELSNELNNEPGDKENEFKDFEGFKDRAIFVEFIEDNQ